MYRLSLGRISAHLGVHERVDGLGTYRWECGCTAKRDKKCTGDQLYWRMCASHAARE